jgi:hypothetical protein
VPVAAAGLADVGVRDSAEAVTGRVEQELLADAARLLVLAAALVQLAAQGGRSLREGVARPLEVGEREHGRAGSSGADRHDRLAAGPRRQDEVAQLRLEPRDLRAQRPPGRGLVGLGDRKRALL